MSYHITSIKTIKYTCTKDMLKRKLFNIFVKIFQFDVAMNVNIFIHI